MKRKHLLIITALTALILIASTIVGVSGASAVDAFTDVKTGWYYDAVVYAVENGLMNGKTDTEFQPNSSMTRAELVTVLWRLEGSPVIAYSDTFGDIPDGKWYTSPVLWAYKNGIVNGTGESTFAPSKSITREQIATIFCKFAGFKGADVSAASDISSFADSGKVSSYAVDSMKWAVGAGLITGKASGSSTLLDPKGNATRAQVAVMFQRFIEDILPDDVEVEPGEAPENEPIIMYTGNTVALPGDIVTVSGEYLDCFTNAKVEGRTVALMQAGSQSLKFEIPESLEPGAFVCELRGPGITEKITINKPVQVWTQGDEGEFATPGGWIRVNGECLSIDGEGVALQLTGPGSYTVAASDVKDAYSVEFALPADVKEGEYTARVYNGYATSDSFTVTVAASPRDSWPTTVFNVLDYGAVQSYKDWDAASATDNSGALKSALAAAKENGGGIVYFPRGSYHMDAGHFTIPENTVIRGEGMNLVRIFWGGGDGSGWTTENIPDKIFSTRNGNVAIEEITFHGALMPTFLQAGLKPKYNEYANNVYITNCRIQSNMYAKCDGFWNEDQSYTEEELVKFNYYNRMMFDARVQNLQITGCEFDWDYEIMGANDQFDLGYFKNLYFANNEVLRSSFHYRADGVIFEDNELYGSNESTFVYGINGEKTYFARNSVMEGADSGDREVMSSDWNTATEYLGAVTFTDDTHVTFPAEAALSDLTEDSAAFSRPRFAVMIVKGTGAGSYRYATARDGDTLTLESAFDTWDETSVFTATRLNSYFYIVDNTFKHTGDLQFYVSQVGGVLDGNLFYDAAGFQLYGCNIYAGWQVDWYISFVNNTLSGGMNYMKFGVDGHCKVGINATSNGNLILMNLANLYRRNNFTDTAYLELYTPYTEGGKSGRDFVVEDNSFENAHWGVYFSGSTCNQGTVVTDNVYDNVDIPMTEVTCNPEELLIK